MAPVKNFKNWKGFLRSIRGVKVDNPKRDARQNKIELSTYITYLVAEGKSIYEDSKVRPYWERFEEEEKEREEKKKPRTSQKKSLRKLLKNLFKPFKKKRLEDGEGKRKGEAEEGGKYTWGFLEPGALDEAKKQLETTKKEDPEKYEKIKQQADQLLDKMKKEDPERYEAFLKAVKKKVPSS